ncbi:FMN-binding glutamate synthase family protein [Fulvimonas soli]|jgi:glutamate synthase domain-containing protein 2|uniref:Glutamate synthase domain-containing protein 2 n=1 Tax=Fulvimonas soli TaxID=155197 RepID=A0A316HSY7_9GAMM|nr:FMN-binding glutamate synthase family protein [Fulvimonas soli]PWK81376.1 glutamate synthase domain-containing protein 2 [Fulvimonas soli]TNY26154.1 FMN-binding glutamate synthase family protein [Fulvimonas soli]
MGFAHWLVVLVETLALLFLLLLAIGMLVLLVTWFVDRNQTGNSVLRNFPVIGHFRYWFLHLGEFFRQYLYSSDREELPFNRAQRVWVYRAAKNAENTNAFGSTRDLRAEGVPFFVNAPFPALGDHHVDPRPVRIGPYAREPYDHAAFFNISAMSFGALSAPAVRALSIGAAKAGIWLDTGEGGLAPYHLEGGCDIVFEIGTAKYGVRTPDGRLDDRKLLAICAHPQVKMVSIKLGQGAKPGMGGLLPAAKVTPEIAAIRGIPAGEDSQSPNRHLDIGNVRELLDAIAHIRDLTGKPTGFKAVFGGMEWIGELCDLVHQRGIESAPDFIIVDGSEGGTGAAPQTLMEGVGLPLHEALPALVNVLIERGLRERVKVICSGKRITAYDVAWALSMGADFVNSARGFMLALGCIQSLQCNRNTCPTGITTQNPRLQRGLVVADKSERVANYARNVMHEVGIIAHSCGLDDPRQLDRTHCRVVGDDGISVPLVKLFPYPRNAG